MDIKDWVTVISVIAVMAGWFVNGYLNRKNEIAKKRLDHRLPTLNSFLDLVDFIREHNQKPDDAEFVRLTNRVSQDFQLYGERDEIDLFEKFIKALENESEKDALESLNELAPLVKKRIRKELNIK